MATYRQYDLASIGRKTLFEHLHDGVFVFDAQDRLVDANLEALKILDWPEPPAGQDAGQIFSTWKELLDAYNASSAAEHIRNEIPHVFRGESVLFELSITTLRDETGTNIGRLLFIHDITARKHLEETQEIFRKYFNGSSMGMCILSPERRWVEANDRLCQILGYSLAELKQLSWNQLTHPADLDAESSLFNGILENTRNSYHMDKRFIRKDGEVVYTSAYVSCYRNVDGSTCYFLATLEDISEIKQTEVAMLKQAAVEERQRLARDLHDSVNQSINGLMLFSETLVATLDKNNIERAKQIAGRIQESARQALKETRLMLYEMQPPDETIGVNLIQDLEIRLLTVERRASVHAQIIQEGAVECIPPNWHENLFWITIEALNNALKYAQARSVQIIIRCPTGPSLEETQRDIPQYLELEIMDDGKGFDLDKPRSGGMGIRNMNERAKLLGGELIIRSTSSEGTTVIFRAELKPFEGLFYG